MSLSNLSSKLDQHAEFLQFVCDHHVEDLHVVVHVCRGYCCYRRLGCLCQGLPHHAPPPTSMPLRTSLLLRRMSPLQLPVSSVSSPL
jgi:hypothetical protein